MVESVCVVIVECEKKLLDSPCLTYWDLYSNEDIVGCAAPGGGCAIEGGDGVRGLTEHELCSWILLAIPKRGFHIATRCWRATRRCPPTRRVNLTTAFQQVRAEIVCCLATFFCKMTSKYLG